MHSVIILSIIAAVFQCGDLPKTATDEVRPDDYSKIQGTWIVEEWTYSGEHWAVTEETKARFKGSEVLLPWYGAKLTVFRLDPVPKLPAIDVTDFIFQPMIGIYELRKDTLLICLDEVSNGRPKEFASPRGSSIHLLKLKRVPK